VTEDDIRVPLEERPLDVPIDVDDQYELWIAYPRKGTFVAVLNHSTYANQPGWFCVDNRRYTAAEVRALGGVPHPHERRS